MSQKKEMNKNNNPEIKNLGSKENNNPSFLQSLLEKLKISFITKKLEQIENWRLVRRAKKRVIMNIDNLLGNQAQSAHDWGQDFFVIEKAEDKREIIMQSLSYLENRTFDMSIDKKSFEDHITYMFAGTSIKLDICWQKKETSTNSRNLTLAEIQSHKVEIYLFGESLQEKIRMCFSSFISENGELEITFEEFKTKDFFAFNK